MHVVAAILVSDYTMHCMGRRNTWLTHIIAHSAIFPITERRLRLSSLTTPAVFPLVLVTGRV